MQRYQPTGYYMTPQQVLLSKQDEVRLLQEDNKKQELLIKRREQDMRINNDYVLVHCCKPPLLAKVSLDRLQPSETALLYECSYQLDWQTSTANYNQKASINPLSITLSSEITCLTMTLPATNPTCIEVSRYS